MGAPRRGGASCVASCVASCGTSTTAYVVANAACPSTAGCR